jgi:phenylacetate-CoA ligase
MTRPSPSRRPLATAGTITGPVPKTLAGTAWLAGARVRNPSLFARYRFLKQSESWPLDRLQAYQVAECRRLLEFVATYSPYYREQFRRVGFSPDRFRSLADLQRIPSIDKDQLLAHNQPIHTQYPFRRLFHCETSGTSGQVLKFRRNERWDSGNRAAVLRGYSWYGVAPWARNGYLWGYNFEPRQAAKTRLLDRLQNRFRLFSYDRAEIEAFARKLRTAEYLHGYSSMIYELAKVINRTPSLPRPRALKLVKGTSEKIYDTYQPEARAAYGCPITSEYGAAETGIIAFACRYGRMHMHMEGCIVEQEDGEILATNLLSYSFPVLRYRLGDQIRLAPEPLTCGCGLAHPVIDEVLGRVGKSVLGAEGAYPSLSFYYVFKNLALQHNVELNYQAVQRERGRLELRIEQCAEDKANLIRAELHKYFRDDVQVELQFGATLHTFDGKLRDFISQI